MKKPLLYTSPDIELQQQYQRYREEYKIDALLSVGYEDEIALVNAHINRLFNPIEDHPLNIDIQKLFIEYLKIKAFLIREQRLEYDRNEKRKHLKSVPVSELNRTAEQCLAVIQEHVPVEEQHIVINKISLIMAQNNNLV